MPKTRGQKRKQGKGSSTLRTTFYKMPAGTGAIVPDRYECALRYCARQTISVSIGVPFQWILRGNAIYDPEVAVGGGNCIGYTALSALYRKYRVLKSRILLKAVHTDTSTTMEVALLPTWNYASIGSSTDPQTLWGNKDAKFALMGSANGGHDVVTLQESYSTSKAFSVSMQAVKDEDNYASDFGTTPSNEWYWFIQIQPVNQTSTDSATVLYAELEYDVVLEKPNYQYQ